MNSRTFLILLLPTLLSYSGFAQDVDVEGKLIETVEVQSDGPLPWLAPGELDKLVALRAGSPFRLTSARATIRQLHATGLFHDVQIETRPLAAGQIAVRVILIRNYRVSELKFRGNVRLNRSMLRSELAFREGEAFSNELLEETVSRLVVLYRDHGYYQATIQPHFRRDGERAQLGVTFQIEAGEQAQVAAFRFQVEGDSSLESLQSEIDTRAGHFYSNVQKDRDMAELRTQLALRGHFAAQVELAEDAPYDLQTNTVSVHFVIRPGPKTSFEFQGLKLSAQQLRSLPLFSRRAPLQILAQETAERIQEDLQKQGYFLAIAQVSLDQSTSNLIVVVDTGRRTKLTEIEMIGNHSLDENSLRRTLQTRTAGLTGRGRLSQSLLQRDLESLRSLYQREGFLEVQTDFKLLQQGSQLKLRFLIDEGPRSLVAHITVEGNEHVDSTTLLAGTQLRPGGPFSPLLLAQDRALIVSRYEDLGYRDIEIRSPVQSVGSNRLAVHHQVTENQRYFVFDTVIAGNLQTKRRVIQKGVLLAPDKPFSLQQSLQSETNLYNLAVFTRVRISDLPVTEQPQQRIAIVAVEEANRYNLVYGIGYSSFEGPRATFGLTDSNLLGSARTLSLGVRAGSRRQRANLAYSLAQPFNRQLPTVLSLSVDNEDRVSSTDGNILLDVRGRPFDSLRYIASVQSEKAQSRRESLFFRYQFERVLLEVPQGLKAPLEFFREEEDLRLSSISLAYLNESRDQPANPRTGFFLSGETQMASRVLGSEEQFLRILTSGQYYHPLKARAVFAASLRLGIIAPFGRTADRQTENPVPISERFFAGGATSLRGLPQDLAGPLLPDLVSQSAEQPDCDVDPVPDSCSAVPEGGNALLVGNFEVRFPVAGFLGAALFYDVGNVFRSFKRVAEVGISNALGLGLVVQTPVGPIRFDAAYNPNPPDVAGFRGWNFHFNLGHPF